MKYANWQVVIFTFLVACSPQQPNSQVSTDPASNEVQVIRDVVYGRKDGLALTYDLVKPASHNGAAVIFINSGGWFSPMMNWVAPDTGSGATLLDESEMRSLIGPGGTGVQAFSPFALLDSGFAVIDLRHGSSTRFSLPEIVEDIHAGIRKVLDDAPEHGIDPSRIGLWGGSAGGHLALMGGITNETGTTNNDEGSRIAAIVAYAPPTDFAPFRPNGDPVPDEILETFPALDFPGELIRELSPINFASSNDPPTLLIHGNQDTTVSLVNSETMQEALESAGAISELIVVEGADHGFLDEDAQMAREATVDWFEAHLN